jgi:hypothetical protein
LPIEQQKLILRENKVKTVMFVQQDEQTDVRDLILAGFLNTFQHAEVIKQQNKDTQEQNQVLMQQLEAMKGQIDFLEAEAQNFA